MDSTRLAELDEQEVPLTGEQIESAIVKAHNIQSSASEIDGQLIDTWNSSILKALKQSDRIDVLGDSITYGVGVDKKERLWSMNFKTLLSQNLGISNLGFVSANNSTPTSIEHEVSFLNEANWTSNFNKYTSLNGFSYDCNSAGEEISFSTIGGGQSKAKIHYVKPAIASVYEIYVNGNLSLTINEDGGTEEYRESDLFSLDTRSNIITIKLISGELSSSGIEYTDGTTRKVNVYATGGRRISHLDYSFIRDDYKQADSTIWCLSYNDVVGGSTLEQQTQAEAYIDDICTHYKDNNKLFIYVNFCWGVANKDNWVLSKMKEVFGNYELFFILDFKETVIDNTGGLADGTYRKNKLLEWADNAHPNNLGSERVFKFVSKRLFNEYTRNEQDIIEKKGNNLVSINSTLNGEELQDCLVMGEGNKLSVPNSVVLGAHAEVINPFTETIGLSSDAGFIRQISRHKRSKTTSNDTETFLRNSGASSFFSILNNTILNVKGQILATDLTNNLHKEFEVSCKIINQNGTNTIISDTGFPSDGIASSFGSLAVSARLVVSSNGLLFGVTGTSSDTINWNSNFEISEDTIGY